MSSVAAGLLSSYNIRLLSKAELLILISGTRSFLMHSLSHLCNLDVGLCLGVCFILSIDSDPVKIY